MVSGVWVKFVRYGLVSTTTMTMAISGTVQAQVAETQQIAFDISGGTLQSALTAFGGRTGLQIIYSPAAVAGHRTSGLRGRFTARAALQRLISGAGLRMRAVSAKVIVLEPKNAPTAAASGGTQQPAASATDQPSSPVSDEGESAEIVVTGSNIRGATPVGSHVRTIRRSEIDRNGFGTVAQVLQSLPGNFGGTATEQSALSLADRTGTNATLSTGVNLRGLGAAATLVLINGRRIAGAGTLGDFADVSGIPMSVVERVEVLMDGASAIYGSDAVGGVVNIIMKKRLDGLESGGRLGPATRGGLREIQAYQTGGTSWSTGSVLLSYEFYDRAPLAAADRRFSRSADSRPLGGTDHRYIYSLPGNVLGFSPTTGGLVAAYAIPPGQSGTALRPGDFIAGSTNLEDFQIGTQLAPQQTRHSIYALAHQDIGSAVHFSLEGRFTRRDFESRSAGYATILSVTRANPWFVSPTGKSSDLIGYAFGREVGPTRDSGWSETMGLTAAVDVDLPAGWQLSAFGAYAQSRELHRTDHLPNEAIIAEALGTAPDNPETAYSPARDGYFNPYGNGTSNAPAVIAAIGSGFNEGTYTNRVITGNLQADGSVLALPAGDLRLAAGANIRREVFQSQYTSFFFTPTPSVGSPVDYGRTIIAGFAEARLPLFGSGNAVPGLRRLDLSIAGRVEHYPDFGTTANPKMGANWSPFDGLMFRGTYGTSFRAPNLGQLRTPGGVSSTVLADVGGKAVRVLQLSGGNPDLEPERARSWTIGIEIAPAAEPGLRVNATLFRTIFDQRIDRPAATSFRTALTNPDVAPFVRRVSPATNAADRDYVTGLVRSLAGGGATIAVDNVAAVIDTRYVNTASTDVRGIDFTAGYSMQRGSDSFSVDANATYLLAWRQRTTPVSAAIDQRNLSGRPAAFRGRTTAAWSRGPFEALVGLNYVGRYRDAITNARIQSWTTIDARIAWNGPAGGVLGNATIAMIAQNLFDRDPPFYDSAAGVGYDAANADATGRFLGLQISKRW